MFGQELGRYPDFKNVPPALAFELEGSQGRQRWCETAPPSTRTPNCSMNHLASELSTCWERSVVAGAWDTLTAASLSETGPVGRTLHPRNSPNNDMELSGRAHASQV